MAEGPFAAYTHDQVIFRAVDTGSSTDTRVIMNDTIHKAYNILHTSSESLRHPTDLVKS
jgi:hypothetical protein